ncbi:MAG: outer membrane beta-barrel protein [Bacteroidetes bacterium]|nr:outer membrane beta-barrel protein [Bacteroidota bacterium]
MKNNLDKWEETLSSKFTEPDFPFDEENWERAEELLDSRLKKDKRKKWMFIYFSGLLCGCLATFFTMKLFLTPGIHQEKIIQTFPVKANNAADVKNNSGNSGIIHSDNSPLSSSGNSTSSNGNSTSRINAHTANDAGNNTNSGQQHTGANLNSSLIIPAAKHTDHSEILVSSSDNLDLQTNKDNFLTEEFHHALKQNLHFHYGNILGEDTIATIRNSNEMLAKSADTAHAKENGHIGSTTDSAMKKTKFIVVAGANYTIGWKYGSGVEARGFNPIAGMEMERELKPKWAVRFGIHYERIGYLKGYREIISDSKPGFGMNNTITTIIPQQLHYMSFPFLIERKTGKHFIAGIGIDINYLFNTTSRIEIGQQTDGNQPQVMQTKNEYGHMDGFNRVDVQLSMFCRYGIGRHWDIELQDMIGIGTIKRQSYFTDGENHGSTVYGARLLLLYTF